MRAVRDLLASVLGIAICANTAFAQTWSTGRERPALFEIVAVDGVGDALWPYGEEDPADDGVATAMADEAAIDLRSVYADARGGRLWLRAYVAGKQMPAASAIAFFFIDNDARSTTGGKADDKQLWAAFDADPTPGGYERAVGMRGDGSLLGVWFWDVSKKQWSQQPERPVLAVAERGVARDPLRLLGDDHAYVQVDVELASVGLDERCAGNVYVRLWNDAMGKRSFGDDAGATAWACRARLDGFGDPEPLQSDMCTKDASCPAQGRCRDGVCVFGYECSADSACRSGEKCTGGVCVRASDATCKDSADCAGLVCASGRCSACSDSGARACASGYVCAPDGSCRSASGSTKPGAGTAGRAAAGSGGDQVRGGAFSCTVSDARGSGARWLWFALLLAALGCRQRGSVQRPRGRVVVAVRTRAPRGGAR